MAGIMPSMSDEVERVEQLLKKIEQEEQLAERVGRLLKERSPAPSRWYDKPVLVGFLGTIIAAVVPATAAIDGCINKSTELELARSRLEHEVSNDYINSYALKDALTQALNPDLSQVHRLRALRFLGAVAPDQHLREWALQEYRDATEYAKLVNSKNLVESAGPTDRASAAVERAEPAEPVDGSLQAQWPRNDMTNAIEDDNPTLRRLNERLEDLKDPKAARQKIEAELARLQRDLSIPGDVKTERLQWLNERLELLIQSSDFAHIPNSRNSDKHSRG